MVPGLEGREAVGGDRLLHLLHAVEEIVHVHLPQLHRVQALHLVHLQLADGAVCCISVTKRLHETHTRPLVLSAPPCEAGEVRARVPLGELGHLVHLVAGEVIVLPE